VRGYGHGPYFGEQQWPAALVFRPVGDAWLQLALPAAFRDDECELTFPFPMWHQLNLWSDPCP